MHDDKDTFTLKINDCFGRNSHEEVIQLSRQFLAKAPGDMDALLAISRALIGLGKLNDAFDILRIIEPVIRGYTTCFAYLGDIYRLRGLNQDALSCYQKYLDLNPDSPLSAEIEAKRQALLSTPVLEQTGDESYRDVAEWAPEFHTVTLAELYVRQGHLDMAMDVLEKIIEKDPDHEMAALRLRELKMIIAGEGASTAATDRKKSRTISELNQWLKNVTRLKDRIAVH